MNDHDELLKLRSLVHDLKQVNEAKEAIIQSLQKIIENHRKVDDNSTPPMGTPAVQS